MKKRKKIYALLLLFLILPCFILPTSANSAQKEWAGRDESGVMATDGDCPLVVEHETLTFDIQDFPNYRNYDNEELSSYTGRVSAEYTFYNPSDMTVTVQMAFPLGDTFQTYAGSYGDYIIKVNGENIDSEMRHTLTSYSDDFDIEKDLPRLLDGYYTDSFFTGEDMQVSEYTITIPDFEGGEYWGGPRCGIDINPADYPNTVFYIPYMDQYHVLDDGTYRAYGNRVRPGNQITYYVIGEQPKYLPSFKVYNDWHCLDDQVLANGVNTLKTGTLTLGELIFDNYDESRGISRIDWYNANLELLRVRRENGNPIGRLSDFSSWGTEMLMTWYCYEVTVGPGERITNEVSSPIYPGVSTLYEPPIYKYTYLLSPAGTWADFGGLDIYINTPYYVTDSSLDGFKKTENGYELHLDGLPREKIREITLGGIKETEGEILELEFTVSTSEKPVHESQTPSGIIKNITYFLLFFGPIILIGVAAIAVLIILILIFKRIFRR